MSTTLPLYGLLLQDIQGFKEDTSFIGDGQQFMSIQILKGSLISRLKTSDITVIKTVYECFVNYKVDTEPQSNMYLFAGPEYVFPLSGLQRDFMLGVKKHSDRLEMLGKLKWIESLKKGSEVYVTIATIPVPVRGVVRYIGGLPGKDGRKFGIELMERKGHGTNGGTFKSVEMFKCEKDCAVFVSMDKLTTADTAMAAKITQTASSSKPPSENSSPIKEGDVVTFYGKNNTRLKGTAKWIGINKSLPDAGVIVGIECDKHLNVSQVIHNIENAKLRQQFTVTKSAHSKVFIPIIYAHKIASRKDSNAALDVAGSQHAGVITKKSDVEKKHLKSASSSVSKEGSGQPSASANKGPPSKHHEYDQIPGEPKDNVVIPDSCNPYNLKVGSVVKEKVSGQYGIIRWIGALSGSKDVHAGVEMFEDMTGPSSNGTWGGVEYFKCKHRRGRFVLLAVLEPGNRRTNPSEERYKSVPLMDAENPHKLTKGSVIQYGDDYGVIKWIGLLHGSGDTFFAGLEMEKDVEEPEDGFYGGTEIYQCRKNKGTFVMLKGLLPRDATPEGAGHRMRSHSLTSGHSSLPSLSTQNNQNPHKLEVGSAIQYGDPPQYGVIKWIGVLPNYKGVMYAGLDMEEVVDNYSNGKIDGAYYFTPQAGRGKFMRMAELQPDQRFAEVSAPNNALQTPSDKNTSVPNNKGAAAPDNSNVTTSLKIESGSVVHLGNPEQCGVVKWIGIPLGCDEQYGGLEMFDDVKNSTDGWWDTTQHYHTQPGKGIFAPLSQLHLLGEKPTQPNRISIAKFELNNIVHLGNPDDCGVIKWMGNPPGYDEAYAGLEMFENINNPTDGWWGTTQYYRPPPGKGLFVPLSQLHLHEKFSEKPIQPNPLGDLKTKIEGFVPASKSLLQIHTGLPKGIQGQHNSCYLDATLYGMFAFSDAFDALFLEADMTGDDKNPKMKIPKIIHQEIVNPLRHVKHGTVPQETILDLRGDLEKIGKAKGLTKEEKDPEEFLNILFKHVLAVEPYLKIKRPSGSEEEFFVQLFLDPDTVVSPNTQSLLYKMFIKEKITFDEYPTRLLLQIPRYGKQFKVFEKVVPSLEMDVNPVCNILQPCLVCGKPGSVVCEDCSAEKDFAQDKMWCFFCDHCSKNWHSHGIRQTHKPWNKQKCQNFTSGTLQLLSVLCIETSHYVCFTRIMGSEGDKWVFFDSMAERPDDEYNRPKVEECTEQIQEWVYGKKDIIKTTERPPELARRFVKDGYLCIYVDKEGIMYK